jgi:hypothetical protein
MDRDYRLPFLEPCTIIDVNMQLWHPLMEGCKFTSFCNANRVYMCLFTSMILDRVEGTSLATPIVWFSCINSGALSS